MEASLKIRYLTLKKEAIVIAREGVKFWINSTRCSDDGKIAFIAFLATTRKIYPKFHSFACYYIYKYSVDIYLLCMIKVL